MKHTASRALGTNSLAYKIPKNHMLRKLGVDGDYARYDKDKGEPWLATYRESYLRKIALALREVDYLFNRLTGVGTAETRLNEIVTASIYTERVDALMKVCRSVYPGLTDYSPYYKFLRAKDYDALAKRWLKYINFRVKLLTGEKDVFTLDDHCLVYARGKGNTVCYLLHGEKKERLVSAASAARYYHRCEVSGDFWPNSDLTAIDSGRGGTVRVAEPYMRDFVISDRGDLAEHDKWIEPGNPLFRYAYGLTSLRGIALFSCHGCGAYMVRSREDIAWDYDQDDVGYYEDEDGIESIPREPEESDYHCASKCTICAGAVARSAANGHMASYSCDAVTSAGKPFLTASNEKKADFYLGVELEVVARGSRSGAIIALNKMFTHETDGAFAVFKSDGSLPDEGFEIVTVPATYARHKETWGKVFEAGIAKHVSSYNIRQCGLHIHIGRAEAFNDVTLGRFMVFYNRDENLPFITAMAGRPIDNDARYCPAKKKSLKSGLKNNIVMEHYEATSISARNKGNTVEVRIFKGNVAADGFFKCLEFCHASVMFARYTSLNKLSIADFLAWFDQPQQRTTYPTLYRFLLAKGYLDSAHVIKDEKKLKIEAA